MKSFRLFVEQDSFVESVLSEFNADSGSIGPKKKTWTAKKADILQTWRNLRPDVPIIIQPIADNPTDISNSTYGEDGIRITGSWPFISAVMARIKEILGYENEQTKLRLVFRGVDKKSVRPDRQSYVFYVNLENRASRKPKHSI